MTPRTVVIREVRRVPVGDVRVDEAPVDLRIEGGQVTAVEPGLTADRADHVVEAGGRWVVPGLWDQHVHLRQWALSLTRLDVSETTHPAEVTRRVRDHVSTLAGDSTDTWVVGYGYRSAVWPEPPTVAALDAASADHPVALISGDGHNGWLNSRALSLLGAPRREGALAEGDWFPLYERLAGLGVEDERQVLASYRRAAREAAGKGVVGVVDFEFSPGHLEWPDRVAAGVDGLRVRAAAYPEHLDDVIARGLRTGSPLVPGSDLVVMGPLKAIFDGSLNTRSAFVGERYADAAVAGQVEARGALNYTPRELAGLMARARGHGLECAIHAIGDAALAEAVACFAETGARGSVEHAQLARAAELDRMADLGIRASVQPAHLLDDRDVTSVCWPDRMDRCFMFGSMARAGVVVRLGSDAPVAPLDPWLAMSAAVHRSADDRPPWNPDEALTAAQALAASTDGQPTVRVGSRGDLVLLDDHPLDPGGDSAEVAARLRSTTVAATFVAGRSTYDALG